MATPLGDLQTERMVEIIPLPSLRRIEVQLIYRTGPPANLDWEPQTRASPVRANTLAVSYPLPSVSPRAPDLPGRGVASAL